MTTTPSPRGRWPVPIDGIVESLIATRGPNDRWNLAALGLRSGDPVTAKTWGETRTRRNFHRRRAGIVQFSADPVDFVDAALSIVERDHPILPSAAAWAPVRVTALERGTEGGTVWERWRVSPRAGTVRTRRVPRINRGFNAVIEATVVASRLSVDAYDTEALYTQLDRLADVVEACGSRRDRVAFGRLQTRIDRQDEPSGSI